MNLLRAPAIAALVLAGFSLSGCVAAAIPIVAGGALVRTGTDGRDASVTVETPAPDAEPAAAELAAAPGPIQRPLSDEEIAQDRLIEPGAQFAVAAPAATPAFASSRRLTRFIRYAGEQAFQASQSDDPHPTAVLVDPAALDGERQACKLTEARPASILIDLDQGSEPFAPENVGLASADLALSLKVLRREGVEIAWISSNSAANADIIRKALAKSGLDPDGEDQLLLLRYPGDRKQTRRKQLALETCLLAIAGDDRSDFDELYEYLTNPDAALELERLIGNGWFLISDQTTPAPAAEPISEPLEDTQEEQSQ